MLQAGYLQFRPVFLDPEKNYAYVLDMLRNVRADLIVLPELPFSGYNFENRDQLLSVAEVPENSDGIREIIKLAGEKNMAIITGFAERENERIFNSALFLTGEGIIARYRKIHLFFREKIFFEPGNLPFEIVNFKNSRMGMMICFDWFFPEVTRLLALNGAQIICHPSNLVLNYCQNVMIGRSIENIIYIITANRTGIEKAPHGDLKFTGQSQIVAPKGNLLRRGPKTKGELFISSIDPSIADCKKITDMNDMTKDRRPEFY